MARSPGRFYWKKNWPYDDRKPCSRCEETKPLDEYGVHTTGFLGRNAMCRACCREEWATQFRRKRKPKKPTAHEIMSDKMRELYGKMVVLPEDEGPVCGRGDEDHKRKWFAPHNTWEHLVAKGYCHGCPLFETCLDLTVMIKPPVGIWAGLNATDRRMVGQTDKHALREEFEYQKHNGAHMPSYRKNHKSYHRWDQETEDEDDDYYDSEF